MNWSHASASANPSSAPRGGTYWDALPPEFKYITFNDHGFATAHTDQPTKAVIKGTGSTNKDGAPEVIASHWNSAGKKMPMGMCEMPPGDVSFSSRILTRPVDQAASVPLAAPAPRAEASTPGMVEKPGIHPTLHEAQVRAAVEPLLPEGAQLNVNLSKAADSSDAHVVEEVPSSTPATVGDLASLTGVVRDLAAVVELLAIMPSSPRARETLSEAVSAKLSAIRQAIGE